MILDILNFLIFYFILFSSPSTHKMSPWVRTVFISFMPKLMFMQRSPVDMPDFANYPEYNGYTNEIDVR